VGRRNAHLLKQEVGRFPEDDEILGLISQRSQ